MELCAGLRVSAVGTDGGVSDTQGQREVCLKIKKKKKSSAAQVSMISNMSIVTLLHFKLTASCDDLI